MIKLVLFFVFLFLYLSARENIPWHSISLQKAWPYKIIGKNDIVIDGKGARLVVTDPTRSAFRIENTSNVLIKNMVIDYDPLPHVAVNILGIDRKHRNMRVKIKEAYAGMIEKNLRFTSKRRSIYIYPLEKPGLVKKAGTPVSRIEKILKDENGTYLMHMKTLKKNIAKGDSAVIVFRTQGAPVFRMKSDVNITFENVTIYASPAAALVGWNVSGLHLQHCKVILKAHRWISSNADGVHCQSCRYGPRIEDSYFEGLGDDVVNLYTKPMKIIRRKNDIFWVRPKSFSSLLKPNDRIDVFDPYQGRVLFHTYVREIRSDKKSCRLTLYPIPPKYSKKVQLYDANLSSQGFVIVRNRFSNSRRHGILLKAHDGLIAQNRFENLGGSAVMMRNSLDHFLEGLNCENIGIENNTMINCGFGRPGQPLPLIGISFRKYNGYADGDEQKNITIKNNILLPYKKTFNIRGTTGLILYN